MRHHPLYPLSLAAALALAPACGDEAPRLQLVTEACTGTAPLEGVSHLLFRVSGEGLEAPMERLAPVRYRPGDVPQVPEGRARVLEVRGYSGHPGRGRLLSLGRSVPFDVPEGGAAQVPVRVFLRRVGSFVPPSSAERPGECLALAGGARAGHTATLLQDGRVLLAGGFRAEAARGLTTLGGSEYFDPVAGTFTPGPELLARARHTATALPDGRVLLAGGEQVAPGGTAPLKLRSATLLEPASGGERELELLVARSRHAAGVDEGGRVLLVGGEGEGGAVVDVAEGFNAAGNGFMVPAPVARVGMAVAPLEGGRRLAVVGGSDERALQAEVLAFAFDGATFALEEPLGTLLEPRRDAAVAPFRDGQQLLVAGGYAQPEAPGLEARLLASSEVVTGGPTPQVGQGANIMSRAEACAVALADGRVVVAGGRRVRDEGVLRSTNEVELLTPTASAVAGALGMGPLERPRTLHTCTALPDGTVLLAGGVDDNGGDALFLDDVLLFTPPPLD